MSTAAEWHWALRWPTVPTWKRDVEARVCVCVCVLTETPLLHCADELKPWPAVSEGISPLNDTKLQGSTSAQHIRRCLRCSNWIKFGWTAVIRLYILLKLSNMNILSGRNSYNRVCIALSTASCYLKTYKIVLLQIIKVVIAKIPNLEINYLHTAQKITWLKWRRGVQWLIQRRYRASPSIIIHRWCSLLLQTTFTE